jgi:hypothetical protein
MKKHLAYGVLLAIVFSGFLSCSSISLKVKDTRRINEPPRATTQTIQPRIQTILWFWLLARFHYINEKGRQIHGWHFDDLALLKAIKDNAIRLWSNHRSDRKIIRLEGWRE